MAHDVTMMNAPERVAAVERATGEPWPVRAALIALALAFLALFLFLPLAAVFGQALSGGLGTYLAALRDPDARARSSR